jgi:hypothetical protein
MLKRPFRSEEGKDVAQAIKLSRAFFLQVLWIGAGNPVFGALPVGFQPFQGATYAFVGDRHRDDPLLQADLGDQFQGPGATVFAEFARAAVQ